jgi:hypothetical protein
MYRGHPWGFPFDYHRTTEKDSVRELVGWLQETLVDDKKVLEGLVKYLERLYEGKEVKRTITDRNAFVYAGLDCARGMCWDAWRETHRMAPIADGYAKPKPEDLARYKVLARQSGRLLTLAERVVKDLLEKSEKQNYLQHRRDDVGTALGIAKSFITSLAPSDGPVHYRHPQAPKWLKLHAQCARALAATWMDEARTNEADANSRNLSVRLPVNFVGATFEEVQVLGFYRDPPKEGSQWQKVHMPVGWTLERAPGSDVGQLLDRRKRLRARINFAEGNGGPSLTFLRKFEVVEVVEGDMVRYRIKNNMDGTFMREESKSVPLADGPAQRQQFERHTWYVDRNNGVVFDH